MQDLGPPVCVHFIVNPIVLIVEFQTGLQCQQLNSCHRGYEDLYYIHPVQGVGRRVPSTCDQQRTSLSHVTCSAVLGSWADKHSLAALLMSYDPYVLPHPSSLSMASLYGSIVLHQIFGSASVSSMSSSAGLCTLGHKGHEVDQCTYM